MWVRSFACAPWSSGNRQSLPRDWLLVVCTGAVAGCLLHVRIQVSWWYFPCVTAWSWVFAGLLLGRPQLFLFLGDLPLRGWVGASWLPMMASSFPLPCRIFSPPSYGLIPIVVVPILLPLFSLWSDAGLRDSSALIRQARLVYDETCPGVPPVILRQHYNLSVLALAFIMWFWVLPRPLPIMTKQLVLVIIMLFPFLYLITLCVLGWVVGMSGSLNWIPLITFICYLHICLLLNVYILFYQCPCFCCLLFF